MFPVYGFGARIPPDYKVGVQVNLSRSLDASTEQCAWLERRLTRGRRDGSLWGITEFSRGCGLRWKQFYTYHEML